MRVEPLCRKEALLVIGLMSGTSADGVDAALCRISGAGMALKCQELAFCSIPYSDEVRARILEAASGRVGGSRGLTLLSFLLGELFLEACEEVTRKAGLAPGDIDLIGSHGQTVHHLPDPVDYCGRMIRGTMQIGDVSAMAERFGCPVVSDFRVRDFAAGGMGAPLVPYTEYLLFRDDRNDTAYQNLGGIGNITVLRRGGDPAGVVAFDTGPGNVILDALAARYTNGAKRCDENGRMALAGRVDPALKAFLLNDPYYHKKPPKTTGRERYDERYIDRLAEEARLRGVEPRDVMRTAAWFTAESVRKGLADIEGLALSKLVVSGGGSHNPVVMEDIRRLVPGALVLTGDEAGINSDSKEAVAFAVLASEAIHGVPNVIPGATGASHPSVLGKIQF